jgi:hypothetical protein
MLVEEVDKDELKQLFANEAAKIIRFLPERDMKVLRSAVADGAESVMVNGRTYLLNYSLRVEEVYIRPAVGFVPCGYFEIKSFIQGEI